MKKLQKLIGITLVIMLISLQIWPILNVKAEGVEFSLSETITKADDPNSKLVTNNDVTITVTNLDSYGSLYAKKIIDVFYNETTNEVSYQFTEDFQTFLDGNETYKDLTIEDYFARTSDNPDGSASTSVITTSTLNILLSEYIINGNGSITYTFTKSGEDDNSVVGTATVETGVYVLESYKAKYLYGVMVANAVPTVNENGEWTIANPTIVAKRSDIETGIITVTKQIMDVEQMMMEVEANCSITLPDFPTNALESKKSFSIRLMPGTLATIKDGDETLTIKEDGTIYKGEVQIGTKKAGSDGDEIEMSDFTKISSGIINLTYTASITSENLNFGTVGNELIVMMVWDSAIYNTSGFTAYEYVMATAYSYAIMIENLEKDSTNTYLNGADYEVYRSYDAETNTLSDKVDVDFYKFDGGASTAVTEVGKYYIKQIKAPTGYRLSKDIIEINVESGSANEMEDGIYGAVVYNETMWFLPSTGGVGTVIYTLLGVSIIIIACFIAVKYHKKRTNKTKL